MSGSFADAQTLPFPDGAFDEWGQLGPLRTAKG